MGATQATVKHMYVCGTVAPQRHFEALCIPCLPVTSLNVLLSDTEMLSYDATNVLSVVDAHRQLNLPGAYHLPSFLRINGGSETLSATY